MNHLPYLSPRLRTVASFVQAGRTIADVGTDHAYLPVWLVGSGQSPSAVASDVRNGPLERAAHTVAQYHMEDRVQLVLSDGLSDANVQEIVIAGMGGELMTRILAQSAPYKTDQHFILQPMTMQSLLHDYLCRNGFSLEREDVAVEGKKHYLIISARPGGKTFVPDPLFCITGILPKTGGQHTASYLFWQAKRLYRKAQGLCHSKEHAEEAEKWMDLACRVEQIAKRI